MTKYILSLLLVGVCLAKAHPNNGAVSLQRSLEENAHAHDDLAESLVWGGFFSFNPNSVYNLTVKVPPEESDPHAGHNHRRLEDDHSGHDHSSHTEDEEDHSAHDHDGDGEPDHLPEDHTDVHFLLALVPVTSEGKEGIEEARKMVEAMEGSLVDVANGAAIAPSTDHAYELSFDDPDSTSSLLFMNLTEEKYVLFLPATPSQVSGDEVHFLVDEVGTSVWPQTAWYYEEPEITVEVSKPWGEVIGATLLINLVTLVGVVFLVPMLTTAFKNRTVAEAIKDLTHSSDIRYIGGRRQKMFDMCITAFACGALLATTVFLIIPEAIVLVNAEEPSEGGDSHEGHDHRLLQEDDHEGHDHGNKNWVFGTSMLAGFLFPLFLASFFPHHHGPSDPHHAVPADTHETVELSHFEIKSSDDEKDVVVSLDESDDDNLKAVNDGEGASNLGASNANGEGRSKKKQINKRLVVGILMGDALHNFADGVFVGAAFLLCDSALGWTIVASTIYHELAQEVSDFFILTTHAHIPPCTALVLNFVSGLSVTLGGIVVLGTDVSNYALGVILSMSAGVYLNVAAKECMPMVDRLAVTLKDRAIAFLFFTVGAVPIGLVLLNHEHCEA